MHLFSHHAVGNFFCNKMLQIPELPFRLDKTFFVWGNLYPDMSELAGLKHFKEDVEEVFQDYMSQAENEELGYRQRSFALGVACHFVCDFFTKYHAKEPYKSKNLISHMFYEGWLHFSVMRFIWRWQFTDDMGFNPGWYFDLEVLLKEYMAQEESLDTDTTYIMHGLDLLIGQVIGTAPIGLVAIEDMIQEDIENRVIA